MNTEAILQIVVAAISALFALFTILIGFRSGVLRRFRLGGFEIEASQNEKEQARALIHAVAAPGREPVPFETEQLAQYYAQVLAQSKISFWFSLIFASLGFLVIIVAVFFYTDAKSGATVAQFAAGVVMDAVAALFFVQSKNAQRSMGDFFDKLRKDRQQVESRTLCDSVHNPDLQDALRTQLSLHYAGLQNSDQVAAQIIAGCLGRPLGKQPTSAE